MVVSEEVRLSTGQITTIRSYWIEEADLANKENYSNGDPTQDLLAVSEGKSGTSDKEQCGVGVSHKNDWCWVGLTEAVWRGPEKGWFWDGWIQEE